MDYPKVSIIIPTKNGAKDIEDCISSVFKQKANYTYEVIVIDSGSFDNTLEVVKKFPARLIEIKPEEFGHGKTRNFGARLAKGEYLVYLTQDAVPADEHWLENLINNLEDEKIVGVYSRWLPKPSCNPLEARKISENFKPIKEIRNLNGVEKGDYLINLSNFVHFSNVSSCIRKSVFERIPFSEKSIYGEDQEWAKNILEAGYTIVYEPQSIVYHSHNDSLKKRFKASFDYAASFNEITGFNINLFFIPISVIITTYKNYRFMKKNRYNKKLKWIIYSIFIYLVSDVAEWLGVHHKRIPKRLKRKFSMVPHVLEADG